jgi:hypothetical protein
MKSGLQGSRPMKRSLRKCPIISHVRKSTRLRLMTFVRRKRIKSLNLDLCEKNTTISNAKLSSINSSKTFKREFVIVLSVKKNGSNAKLNVMKKITY